MEQLVKESPKQLEVRDAFREGIMSIEKKMMEASNTYMGKEFDKVNPLTHSFGDGCYIREIFMPKGQILITKIHKIKHPFFIMSGDISIMTEHGIERVKAPFNGITNPGTKRIIYTHEDTIFITVHVTTETDVDKIVKDVTAENFEEIDKLESQKYIDIITEEEL